MSEQFGEQPQANQRQRVFNIAPIIVWLIGICALVHVARIYVLSNEQNILAMFYGAFIPARYNQGVSLSLEAVTSTVSYSFLHGSFAHLLNNCLWLAVFGSPLAYTIGSLRLLLLWVISAVIAALFHYLGQPSDIRPMIGASGAVAGFMGAAARFGFAINKQGGWSSFGPSLPPFSLVLKNRSVLTFLGIFFVSNLLIGSGQFNAFGAGIAWQAHIGGIVAGFLLIPWFLPPKSAH